MIKENDFVIQVATVNGSGSQSSNNVLVRSLFRAGIPVGGKNLFPSNIQGLPTWFTIRANPKGFVGRQPLADVVLALNPQTALADLKSVKPQGFYFYNSEITISDSQKRNDIQMIAIPFKDIVASIAESIKLKKLLVNMSYVGILCELLGLEQTYVDQAITQQFEGKQSVLSINQAAIKNGRDYAKNHLSELQFPYRAVARPGANADKILIDGNSASAIGLLYGGVSFVSWYPITPSSSLVETFEDLSHEYRTIDGKRTCAVIQAEDELAAISMVVGAGWMGARALTSTSGPGLSLMSEAAGLSYFAEVPAVIWDVQRVGPSTGLPTRTMQGDLEEAYKLSHGDTKHVVLLPATAEECFEFAQTCFDLAERLQTLVIVLSDLDLGMNFHMTPRLKEPTRSLDRGKVLSIGDLEKLKEFQRYKDVDGDGIPYRTLPGTEHKLASYFARGSGHDEAGRYSEDAEVYQKLMDRLNKKYETARALVPAPEQSKEDEASVGLIAFGSTHLIMPEIRSLLGQPTSYLRIRALPLNMEIGSFLKEHSQVFVLEQNRDGQMHSILRSEFPEFSQKMKSIRVYDGLPASASVVVEKIKEMM